MSTSRQIAPHGAGPRQSAPKHSLEIGEPVVDQPVPDVTRLRAGFGLPCEPQRLMRHLEFRAIGKVGQVLDGRSVPVARLECHDAVDVRRILSQDRFDAAGPIDHVGPFDGLHADQGGQGIRHRHRGVAGRSPRGFGSWLERRSKVRIEQAERGHEPIQRDQTHHRWQGPKLRVGQHGDILIGVQVLHQRLHRNLVLETIRQILRQGEHSWNTAPAPALRAREGGDRNLAADPRRFAGPPGLTDRRCRATSPPNGRDPAQDARNTCGPSQASPRGPKDSGRCRLQPAAGPRSPARPRTRECRSSSPSPAPSAPQVSCRGVGRGPRTSGDGIRIDMRIARFALRPHHENRYLGVIEDETRDMS